jgi:hypothetical protein
MSLSQERFVHVEQPTLTATEALEFIREKNINIPYNFGIFGFVNTDEALTFVSLIDTCEPREVNALLDFAMITRSQEIISLIAFRLRILDNQINPALDLASYNFNPCVYIHLAYCLYNNEQPGFITGVLWDKLRDKYFGGKSIVLFSPLDIRTAMRVLMEKDSMHNIPRYFFIDEDNTRYKNLGDTPAHYVIPRRYNEISIDITYGIARYQAEYIKRIQLRQETESVIAGLVIFLSDIIHNMNTLQINTIVSIIQSDARLEFDMVNALNFEFDETEKLLFFKLIFQTYRKNVLINGYDRITVPETLKSFNRNKYYAIWLSYNWATNNKQFVGNSGIVRDIPAQNFTPPYFGDEYCVPAADIYNKHHSPNHSRMREMQDIWNTKNVKQSES